MAWYPAAEKMELQPESDSQPAIRPTQFIVHSIVAPWTPQRTYEYWRDSTNLESHFGLGYDGSLGQFIGTQTRADANAAANLRADGTGAVSLESASNLQASDPWTPAQVESLIKLGVWLHQEHGIPLRICRTADDPGFGYHRLFDAWNPSAHSCPGDARVKQFREAVFPGIVARATGTTTEEDDVALTDADINKVAIATVNHLLAGGGVLEGGDVTRVAAAVAAKLQPIEAAQNATIDKLVGAVATLAANVGGLDPAAIVAELKQAIESITIHLDADGA
jgi:hypothetical protein